jgi:hypothetical protein
MLDFIYVLVLGLMSGAVCIGLIEVQKWMVWKNLVAWQWVMLPFLLPLGAWCWSCCTFVSFVRDGLARRKRRLMLKEMEDVVLEEASLWDE